MSGGMLKFTPLCQWLRWNKELSGKTDPFWDNVCCHEDYRFQIARAQLTSAVGIGVIRAIDRPGAALVVLLLIWVRFVSEFITVSLLVTTLSKVLYND